MALGHWLKDYIGPHSGGSGGESTEPLIVNDNNGTLDKTWQEIHDAFVSGQNVIIHLPSEGDATDYLVYQVGLAGGSYDVVTNWATYSTSTAGGYPVSASDS